MDEKTRAYLDAMMVQINKQFERVLDNLTAVRAETDSLNGHVIYVLQDSLTLSRRITRLQGEIRRSPKGT